MNPGKIQTIFNTGPSRRWPPFVVFLSEEPANKEKDLVMVTTNINQVNLRRLKAVATVCHTIAVQAGRLFRAYRSYKTKRLLQDLTDNQLRDIGLHRHDIARIVFGPTRTNH